MGSRRIRREKKTISVMVSMYCRAHHGGAKADERVGVQPAGLCPACRELLDYAEGRIDRCAFKDAKPACNRCRVHCYGREKREDVRSVMRFSGPRMTVTHPVLALLHLADAIRHHGEPRVAASAAR
jgi:hypothetical protein